MLAKIEAASRSAFDRSFGGDGVKRRDAQLVGDHKSTFQRIIAYSRDECKSHIAAIESFGHATDAAFDGVLGTIARQSFEAQRAAEFRPVSRNDDPTRQRKTRPISVRGGARGVGGGSMPSLVIAQGGGPTAVINQTLVGATLAARKRYPGAAMLGARHGVRGIRDGDIVDLSAIPEADLRRIASTPNAALGSTRDKPDAAYCEVILDGAEDGSTPTPSSISAATTPPARCRS